MIFYKDKEKINKSIISYYIKNMDTYMNLIDDLNNNPKRVLFLRNQLDNIVKSRKHTKHKYISDIVDSNKSVIDKNKELFDEQNNTACEKSAKRVFALSPKTKNYCLKLQDVIKNNIINLKNTNLERIFLPLYSNNKLKKDELSELYNNIAYVVICIICKAFTTTTVERYSIPQTTLKKIIGLYFIETYVLISHQLEAKKHEDCNTNFNPVVVDGINIKNSQHLLELNGYKDEKDLVELGLFLLECVLNTSVIDDDGASKGPILKAEELESFTNSSTTSSTRKTKIHYSLTDTGEDLLSILPNYGYNLPVLCQNLIYKEDKVFYYNRQFTFSMYRYADNTHIRDSNTKIGNLVYKALNQLQNVRYKINRKQLNIVKQNFLEFFLMCSDFNFVALEYSSPKDYIEATCPYESNTRKKECIDQYIKSEAALQKTIDTLCIADIFKFEIFFFNHFLDFRGRIYCDGYPLNPQGDVLSRSLLCIANYDVIQGNDVSGSGFQIIGLLTGCNKLLELTNYKERLIYPKTMHPDLYTYIGENFIKYLKTYDKKKDIDYKKYACTKIFNRETIKKMSMCYIYGEGNKSRSDKIEDAILSAINESPSKNIQFSLAEAFQNYIESEFDELNKFKNFMIQLCSAIFRGNIDGKRNREKGKSLKLMILAANPKHISTVLTYMQMDVTRPTFYNPLKKTRDRLTLIVPKQPLQTDYQKVIRSVVPNYIHMLDSIVAANLIHKSIETPNLVLFSIHDSFYTSPDHTSIVNYLYHYAIRETFIFNDPLQMLLELNKDNIPKDCYPILQEMKNEFRIKSLKSTEEICKKLKEIDEKPSLIKRGMFNYTLKIDRPDYDSNDDLF